MLYLLLLVWRQFEYNYSANITFEHDNMQLKE